jgi:hypothetical protein
MQPPSDDTTRAVLAIAIWVAFITSLVTLILHSPPKENVAIVTEMMTTLASGVALVTNYYFKRKH